MFGLEIGNEAERSIANIMEVNALVGEVTMTLLRDPTQREQAQSLLTRSLMELRRAKERIRRAQNILSDLAHYIEANPHPAYEQHLQNCGFRGTYFILTQYKHHLTLVYQTIIAAEERWHLAEEAIRLGELDSFVKDFSPGVNSALRTLCFECVEMMRFQHDVAQTRYAMLSFAESPLKQHV